MDHLQETSDVVDRKNETCSRNETWRDVFLLLLLGTLLFLPRLNDLCIRGEEPRRILCAWEIIRSGNWFVPTFLERVFITRPPFQNWIIALTGSALGDFGPLSGRLPSFFCAIATTLVIYFYCRSSLSAGVSLLAGFFFLTTLHVVKYASLAETEIMFCFLLSGAYLFWHMAELRGWSNLTKWTVAYLFLACATLTKGVNQAPIYFALIIGLHLFLNRKLRELFSVAHFVGLLVFVGIIGFWQIGFLRYESLETAKKLHLGDTVHRFREMPILERLEHWLLFPFEEWAVLLPWSLFLLVFLSKDFRRRFRSFAPPFYFCLGALAVTFFTVWYPAAARTRYYIPMIPCVAVLAAMIVAKSGEVWQTGEARAWWSRIWIVLLVGIAGLLPIVGVALPIVAFGWPGNVLLPVSLVPSIITFAVLLAASVVLFMMIRQKRCFCFRPVVLALGLGLACFYNMIYVDVLQKKYFDIESKIPEALKVVPEDAVLYALEDGDFGFIYYYALARPEASIRFCGIHQVLSPGAYFIAKDDYYSRWKQADKKILYQFDRTRYKPRYESDEPHKTVVVGVVPERITDTGP